MGSTLSKIITELYHFPTHVSGQMKLQNDSSELKIKSKGWQYDQTRSYEPSLQSKLQASKTRKKPR